MASDLVGIMIWMALFLSIALIGFVIVRAVRRFRDRRREAVRFRRPPNPDPQWGAVPPAPGHPPAPNDKE